MLQPYFARTGRTGTAAPVRAVRDFGRDAAENKVARTVLSELSDLSEQSFRSHHDKGIPARLHESPLRGDC